LGFGIRSDLRPSGCITRVFLRTYLFHSCYETCRPVVWAVTYLLNYLLTNLLTYLFIPYSTALLEKLTVSQIVKKFPAFYGTRKFITACTRALHLSLSWDRSMQSMPSHPISWIYILILSSHLCLGLPSGMNCYPELIIRRI